MKQNTSLEPKSALMTANVPITFPTSKTRADFDSLGAYLHHIISCFLKVVAKEDDPKKTTTSSGEDIAAVQKIHPVVTIKKWVSGQYATASYGVKREISKLNRLLFLNTERHYGVSS